MSVDFTCNVCGLSVEQCPEASLDRETPSCPGCGSSVRQRSIVHLLSLAVHGRSLPLPDWPVKLDVAGLGLSDWAGYADRLSAKVDYKNTFIHKEPFLDIVSPGAADVGRYDFLISSDDCG